MATIHVDAIHRERFGEPSPTPALTTDTIELQLRHRSVRRFLPEGLADRSLQAIIAAAQSASHSSNLQCWSVVVVRDPDRRALVAELLGGNKPYIVDAPVFLVWVADLHRASTVLDESGQEMETIRYLEGALVPFVDIGIAAQNALLAAESLGLGGVFVGSLRNNPGAMADLLDLPPRTFPALGMALGHPDPAEAAGIKPRLEQSAVVHEERYRLRGELDAARRYERRLATYYERFGVDDYSWFRRLVQRLGPRSGLNGRHALRQQLQEQGFFTE